MLYALRAMGAGDVKLMAAVGSMVGWEDWFGIFIITAIVGGVAALLLVLFRGRLKNDSLQRQLHLERNEERTAGVHRQGRARRA